MEDGKRPTSALWPQSLPTALPSSTFQYFRIVLANKLGARQNKCSFFALDNKNRVIVGLDSAYYASEENLFLDGLLYDHIHRGFLRRERRCGLGIHVKTWRIAVKGSGENDAVGFYADINHRPVNGPGIVRLSKVSDAVDPVL